MKKIILLIVVFFTFFTAHATHIMGGEITWVCIKDPLDPDVGKYIFTLKIYRDCAGAGTIVGATQTIEVWDGGVNPISTIILDFISASDISPSCNTILSGNDSLDCASGDPGAVEEFIYISQPKDLPGLPPATGWHFTWDSCCRNGATTN